MAHWVFVAAREELDRQNPLGRKVEGVSLLLALRRGQIVAIADECPHLGAPLSAGSFDGTGHLVCPAHRWKIDLFGLDPTTPCELRGRHHPVRERGGRVEVDLDS